MPGTRSTFAERQTGREYIDIVPDRDAIARYGLTVRDVHDVVEAAIGGMPVSTAIVGRSRFSINVRFVADHRADPETLRAILVPVPVTEPVADGNTAASGSGRSTMTTSITRLTGGDGMAGMGGSAPSASAGSSVMGSATQSMAASGASGVSNQIERYRQPGAVVPLGALADIRVVTGPAMIKDEDGVLVGFVFVDIDLAARDLGGWVTEAKALVGADLKLATGTRLVWTGQYEFMAEMEARMRLVVPFTLVLIVILLYLSMNGWAQTLLVLTSLPFAIAGSIWLLAALDYNLSTAAWVGMIAVGGVAAQTGVIIVVYLDEAFARAKRENRLTRPEDVDAIVIEGASRNVRPMVMTVATTVLGLMPLLWESGVGADVTARTAAPVIGGLWSCMFLTLLVIPAVYAIWRRRQVALGLL